jgi:cbb3-type cytochrome oxidase maturation protein
MPLAWRVKSRAAAPDLAAHGMEILYLLIPLSAVLVLIILGVFGWAVHRGQFDELEHEGTRILAADDGSPPEASVDDDQSGTKGSPEQSRSSQSGLS